MSNANAVVSSPNSVIIAVVIACEIASSCSTLTACRAPQDRGWWGSGARILVNRSAALCAHQSAILAFEHGAVIRLHTAIARYVPTEHEAPATDPPVISSITSITLRRRHIDQTAATSPNARWRVRCGIRAVAPASNAAATSAAEPRYRSEPILGLPSTRAIVRRYQYVWPFTFFGYKLDTL